MDNITLFMTALALAMDAFAVSVSNSLCYPKVGKQQIVLNSASFGLFQGLMPLLGFFFGVLLGDFIRQVDHWLALVLLGVIGGKMLVEGIRELRSGGTCDAKTPEYTFKTMLAQSLATSIDALAVGISFAAFNVNIWLSISVIAVITFACCVLGGIIGKKFGALLGDWAQIFGGCILVFIGAKIFVEHMFGG